MSIPPWRSTAASTIASTSPGSLTSARKKEAEPPPLDDLLGRLLSGVGLAADEEHPGAFAGEDLRYSPPYPLAPAGDYYRLLLCPVTHWDLLAA